MTVRDSAPRSEPRAPATGRSQDRRSSRPQPVASARASVGCRSIAQRHLETRFARSGPLLRIGSVGALIIGVGSGCITGSLATNTGPSATGWSTQSRQHAHVGEEVTFSFVLTRSPTATAPVDPRSVVDYALLTIGPKTWEMNLGDDGHFRATCEFSQVEPGQRVTARAAAYRLQSDRDGIVVDGAWVPGAGPLDAPDLLVAEAGLDLTFYRSRIELPIPWMSTPLALESGFLELRRSADAVTRVKPATGQARGFTYVGPDPVGAYRVTYEPAAEELNRWGTTPLRFTIHDASGMAQVLEAVVSTP